MNVVTASTPAAWRDWLARHGRSEREAWLVIHRNAAGIPSLRYHEAVEHALCYGWIDSRARPYDDTSSVLRFTPRNPASSWSRVNRERAERMIAQGLMTEAGQAVIDLAKARGTWQAVPDEVASTVPDDLRARLVANPAAAANFDRFPPSAKRLILTWIATAKRPETRQRRIQRTVAEAAQNRRAVPAVRATARD